MVSRKYQSPRRINSGQVIVGSRFATFTEESSEINDINGKLKEHNRVIMRQINALDAEVTKDQSGSSITHNIEETGVSRENNENNNVRVMLTCAIGAQDKTPTCRKFVLKKLIIKLMLYLY